MTLAIGLAAACGEERSEEPEPSDLPAVFPRLFRGHLMLGHEVRAFRPCGSDQALWALDESGSLWATVSEFIREDEPYDEVFAVVEGYRGAAPADGFGADYPGAVRVENVLYVGGEGPGCDDAWEFAYRARGNEPFWSATVSSVGLRVTRLGEPDIVWPEATAEISASSVRYVGAGDPGGVAVELVIVRESCRDSMSGAYFGHSAELRLGEKVLTGCALKSDG